MATPITITGTAQRAARQRASSSKPPATPWRRPMAITEKQIEAAALLRANQIVKDQQSWPADAVKKALDAGGDNEPRDIMLHGPV